MTPTALGYEKFVADKCAKVGGLYAMNASVCAADYAAACVAEALQSKVLEGQPAPAQDGDRATRGCCLVYSEPCPEHRFVHGAEAEELRQGLERFLEIADDIPAWQVRNLLDQVDARDSCAFAEAVSVLEDAAERVEPAAAQAPSIAHHENCDALQLGPQLGPSTKPCNCGAAAQAAEGAK
jgi:hypothetical protein